MTIVVKWFENTDGIAIVLEKLLTKKNLIHRYRL